MEPTPITVERRERSLTTSMVVVIGVESPSVTRAPFAGVKRSALSVREIVPNAFWYAMTAEDHRQRGVGADRELASREVPQTNPRDGP